MTLNERSATVGAGGGVIVVPLALSHSSCDVDAYAIHPWIKVTVVGSYVGLSVATNTGAARVGAVSINYQNFTVSQEGAAAGCSFGLDRTAHATTAAGDLEGAGFQLTTASSACAWRAHSNARWVQVYPLSGQGSVRSQVTVLPNFSNRERSATVNIAGQTLTITQSGNPEPEDRRFVRLLYFNFFGRSPDAQEVQYHVNSLSSGITRAGMALNFRNSQEFRNTGKYVGGLYVGLLDRDAEYSGWQFQRNELATARAHFDHLTRSFLQSAEYKLRFGIPDDEEFVTLLYRYVLGREPTPSEVAFHVNSAPMRQGRHWVAFNFLRSDEFDWRTRSRLDVFLLYATLLMRDPTNAERYMRTVELDAGISVSSLIEEILAGAGHAQLLN
jgi:hypothetical protein